jgi:putative ABC transport system permease protein
LIGESIVINNERYQITGVVKDVSRLATKAWSEIWVPIRANRPPGFETLLSGSYVGLVEAERRGDIPAIQAEIQALIPRVVITARPEYKLLSVNADTDFEGFTRDVLGQHQQIETSAGTLAAILIAMMIVFMALPSINLVNINLSRIMERQSEIGARKAFGASSRTLTLQFIVENLILTALGGAIGFVLAWAALWSIQGSGLIPYAELRPNFRIFAYALAMVGLFALLSGCYPAWRMARMNPVTALKGGLS